ncbi:MAG: phosphopentomutase, partial [Planctomycetota bacterium]
MMGIILDQAFSVFPNGFPEPLINDFLAATGFESVLGNRSASGTAIIQELGSRHVRTGAPIVYTSADSVFQIAAHDEIIPLDRLYAACLSARTICDRFRIGRVIARPFTGREGGYTRTVDRKDFAMLPPEQTVLDTLTEHGIPVIDIGKIENIFVGRGIAHSYHTRNNIDGMRVLSETLSRFNRGLFFLNLIDFDMLFGHRNDAAGYAKALEAFDQMLGELLAALLENDVLILTSDHGCDPTWPGTDHTREYAPLLLKSVGMEPRDLGVRTTFADVGATILDLFDIDDPVAGTSLLQ